MQLVLLYGILLIASLHAIYHVVLGEGSNAFYVNITQFVFIDVSVSSKSLIDVDVEILEVFGWTGKMFCCFCLL